MASAEAPVYRRMTAYMTHTPNSGRRGGGPYAPGPLHGAGDSLHPLDRHPEHRTAVVDDIGSTDRSRRDVRVIGIDAGVEHGDGRPRCIPN